MSERVFFVAQVSCWWEDQEMNVPYPFSRKMDDGMVGFMPIYETEEEAKAAWPDSQILMIRALRAEADRREGEA